VCRDDQPILAFTFHGSSVWDGWNISLDPLIEQDHQGRYEHLDSQDKVQRPSKVSDIELPELSDNQPYLFIPDPGSQPIPEFPDHIRPLWCSQVDKNILHIDHLLPMGRVMIVFSYKI
jgi:hypothetical protein